MIVSELQFLEVEGEPLRGDTMVFHDALLGVAPESLQAVDVYPAPGEVLPVVHAKVSKTAEHECVVDLVAISIDDASSTHLLDRECEDGFGSGVGDHLHENSPLPLQNAEYRDFPGRATAATRSFSLPAEVGLVHFDFASDEGFPSLVGVSQDGGTDRVDGLIGCIVGESKLLSNSPDGEFQFEELDEAQPLSGSKISAVDPPSGEIVEGVAA